MNSLYVDRETGRKAQELYDNLVPYFNQIEDNLNAQFKACPVRDQDGLTLIHIHFKMLEAVLPRKVFFGSDAPLNIVTYKSSIEYIKCLPQSVAFKQNLLYNNAKEFYTGEWRKTFGKGIKE